MRNGGELMKEYLSEQLLSAAGTPPDDVLKKSSRQVGRWFEQAAPLVRWDVVESPLGPLYIAVSSQGLCSLDFGVDLAVFLSKLDPLARIEQNPKALAHIVEQLHEYFARGRFRFDVSLDLGRLTPFQQSVLQTARTIPAGTVWTYRQVATAIGRPKASRAAGQALAHNPVPIIVPCHRVVASNGRLGGYSGGGGLGSKRLLLRHEGAL